MNNKIRNLSSIRESMYREEILDLYKNPLNKGILKNPTHKFRKLNPLCGDEIEIQLIIDNNKVKDVKFSGVGFFKIPLFRGFLYKSNISSLYIDSRMELRFLILLFIFDPLFV